MTIAEQTEDHTTRFAPTARERWYTGSGQPAPEPTTESIAATIHHHLADVLGDDAMSKPDVKAALIAAASAVRGYFTTQDNTKDSN